MCHVTRWTYVRLGLGIGTSVAIAFMVLDYGDKLSSKSRCGYMSEYILSSPVMSSRPFHINMRFYYPYGRNIGTCLPIT